MYIRIKADDICYNVNFESRLNIIVGNSGTDKTIFYDLLSDFYNNEDTDINVKSSLPVVTSNLKRYAQDMQLLKNTILIFDDINVIEKQSFSISFQKYAVENNLFILLMSREDNLNLKAQCSFFQFVNQNNVVANVPFSGY